MRLPDLALLVEINRAVRERDEWFDEPDDLERVKRVLDRLRDDEDPIRSAGRIAARLARAQAFAEGNKRTALLAAKWVLDRNGVDGTRLIPPDDRVLGELLIRAASGHDVEQAVIDVLEGRT